MILDSKIYVEATLRTMMQTSLSLSSQVEIQKNKTVQNSEFKVLNVFKDNAQLHL
jgi:hypothetical protein